MKAKTPQNDVD